MIEYISSDRRKLRNIFDAAERYHDARPRSPSALYDEFVLTTGLRPGEALLEIGGARARPPSNSRGAASPSSRSNSGLN